nr:MAG TPA: hypothetical protein [Caudoviricetes sp.]
MGCLSRSKYISSYFFQYAGDRLRWYYQDWNGGGQNGK